VCVQQLGNVFGGPGATEAPISGRLYEGGAAGTRSSRSKDLSRGRKRPIRLEMEGTLISDENNQTVEVALGELLRELLADLYHALSGHAPKAVRIYGDGDALLLLLRFDPAELWGGDQISSESLIEATFVALPDMIASAVERRQGRILEAGDLSVCTERGLAVFAFRALEAAPARRGDGRQLFASLKPPLSPAAASFT
jgi:hypothetical protein